jgi:hypothetical protein
MVKGTFWKFSPKKKTLHISKKKNSEIAKIFGGFGQIFSSFLLKSSYLANKF